MRAVLTFGLVLALAACGPVSVQQAEAECLPRARKAVNPLSGTTVGMGSDGLAYDLDLEVNSDFVQGRDPAQVFESCVYARSGQPPSTPLYNRPDWRR